MVPERIEREILIDAPVEAVWTIATEPEHVGSWFNYSAEIDLRPGGEAILTWEEHGSARAWVEKVDPPHSFSFRWAPSRRCRASASGVHGHRCGLCGDDGRRDRNLTCGSLVD